MKYILAIFLGFSSLYAFEYDKYVEDQKDYDEFYSAKLEEISTSLKSLENKINVLISYYEKEFYYVGSKRPPPLDLSKQEVIQDTN